MELTFVTDRFLHNAESIRHLAGGLSYEQGRWRPAASKWSILEIVNHLADEEVEDFRTRVDFALHKPGEAPPGIDPEGWVTARGYQDRDPEESLQRFLTARAESLEWLASLEDPDWDLAWEHPKAGIIRAGDFLASWLAHDWLHMRQLAQRHFQYWNALATPYGTDYAGAW